MISVLGPPVVSFSATGGPITEIKTKSQKMQNLSKSPQIASETSQRFLDDRGGVFVDSLTPFSWNLVVKTEWRPT